MKEKNIAVALFIVSGVVLFGLLARFPYSVWVMVDIGIAITCGICGFKLIKMPPTPK